MAVADVSSIFCGAEEMGEIARVFGDSERLISYSSSLMEAGLPNGGVGTWISSADSSVSEYPASGLIHVRCDDGRCLSVGAVRVDGGTWFASPVRALLDLAEDMPASSSGEVLVKVLWSGWVEGLDWEEVPVLAEELGFCFGLRRLCSAAVALESLGERWDGSEVLLSESLKPDSSCEWIDFSAYKTCPNDPGWQDSEYKVAWADSPEKLVEAIAY